MAALLPEVRYGETMSPKALVPPEYLEFHPDVYLDVEYVERKGKGLFRTPREERLDTDAITDILEGLSDVSKTALIKYLHGARESVDAETFIEFEASIGKRSADDYASQVGGYALEAVVKSDWHRS